MDVYLFHCSMHPSLMRNESLSISSFVFPSPHPSPVLPSTQVVSCTPETPALEAMRLMVAEGVSSLAVVTGARTRAEPQGAAEGAAAPGVAETAGVVGRLLGNFSASDLRWASW